MIAVALERRRKIQNYILQVLVPVKEILFHTPPPLHGGELECHRRMDSKSDRPQTTIPSPKGGKLRKALARTGEELARRFYQLLSGHAATAEHLMRVGQAQSNLCWWCGRGERQSRYRLFVRCQRWGPEIRRLWQRIRLDWVEWSTICPTAIWR